jgi:hypothetical protein
VTVSLFSFLLSTAQAVKPLPDPAIISAVADFSTNTISITGQNFSNSPSVFLDNTQLVVTSANATNIQATLPNGIEPGSYHLVERNAGGKKEKEAFLDVTIGDGDLGNSNTAEGTGALLSLTTGTGNTAVGTNALFANTTGLFNDAVGGFALESNTDASSNNAFGNGALFSNVHAADNTAIGDVALAFNDSDGASLGNNNTAVGATTLFNNVDGSENTAVGTGAGQNVIAGTNNTYIGDFVGSLAPDESNTIRIGDLSNGNGAGSLACFIGGIFNNFQPVGGTVVEVTLDLANDKLGWDFGTSGNKPSSAPVQRGAPVRRSAPGAPTQRPAILNGKVEKLEATVAQQQKQIEILTAQLKEQAAQIQKVSAQLIVGKPAPQVVANKP